MKGKHRNETGATAVEYALMIAFVALVIFGTVVIFGQEVLGLFESIPDSVWD